MTADVYLTNILNREAVDVGIYSPVRALTSQLLPFIREWGDPYLMDVQASGSFAKGTANRSGTDLDIFISLSSTTPFSLHEIYEKLFTFLEEKGFRPRRQNVSINIRYGGYSVDLVPGKRQNDGGLDHSLWRRRANTWTKTNIDKHISHVIRSQRAAEIRIIKLWRDQKGLDFPSFYLEMVVIEALSGANGTLSQNVWRVFQYLQSTFEAARFIDPSNTNNVISDDLTPAEKVRIKVAAGRALAAKTWDEIVK